MNKRYWYTNKELTKGADIGGGLFGVSITFYKPTGTLTIDNNEKWERIKHDSFPFFKTIKEAQEYLINKGYTFRNEHQ